jgi:hypothetical protein
VPKNALRRAGFGVVAPVEPEVKNIQIFKIFGFTEMQISDALSWRSYAV